MHDLHVWHLNNFIHHIHGRVIYIYRTLFANLIGSTQKTSKQNYLHLQYQYLDNTQQIPFSDAEYRFLNLS